MPPIRLFRSSARILNTWSAYGVITPMLCSSTRPHSLGHFLLRSATLSTNSYTCMSTAWFNEPIHTLVRALPLRCCKMPCYWFLAHPLPSWCRTSGDRAFRAWVDFHCWSISDHKIAPKWTGWWLRGRDSSRRAIFCRDNSMGSDRKVARAVKSEVTFL